MPWKAAKAAPPPCNALFDACFRIQREACEAAGRYIPLIVENVRGAQPWVGRSRWNFGSFHLWGDVPALMPIVRRAVKIDGTPSWSCFRQTGQVSAHWRMEALKADRIKQHGSGAAWFDNGIAQLPSDSARRKQASALIAKIPLPLSRHIARVFYPSGAGDACWAEGDGG